MYDAGNTVPTEWPKRADRSTYETYAKLPSWHVEEAASLSAGLIPRQSFSLNFRPIHSVPGEPKPYEDAKPWGVLLEETGPVGRVIALLARARGLSNWGFSGSDFYIEPAEFAEFCDKYGIAVPDALRETGREVSRSRSQGKYGVIVPDDLRETVREGFGSKSKAKQKSAEAKPRQLEERYRSDALQVARELKEVGARVTVPMFQKLIQSGFAPKGRTVLLRQFQGYLGEHRERLAGQPLLRAPGARATSHIAASRSLGSMGTAKPFRAREIGRGH